MIYNYLKEGYFDGVSPKISGISRNDTRQKMEQRSAAKAIKDFKHYILDGNGSVVFNVPDLGDIDDNFKGPADTRILRPDIASKNLMSRILWRIFSFIPSQIRPGQSLSFYSLDNSFCDYGDFSDSAKLFYLDPETIEKLKDNNMFRYYNYHHYIRQYRNLFTLVFSVPDYKIVQKNTVPTVVLNINYNIEMIGEYTLFLRSISDALHAIVKYRGGRLDSKPGDLSSDAYSIYNLLYPLHIYENKKKYSIYDLISSLVIDSDKVKSDFEILSKALSEQPIYEEYCGCQIPIKFDISFSIGDIKTDQMFAADDTGLLRDVTYDTRQTVFHFETP